MANKVVNIYPSATTILSDIKTALVEKYGAGLTVHYQTVTDLIFTCPAVSAKVLSFYCNSGMFLRFSYADAWVSTTTLTNAVIVATSYSSSYSNWTSIALALGDEYILLNTLTPSSEIYSMLVLFGKTTTGQNVAVSGVGSKSTATVYTTFRSKLIDTNEDIRLGGLQYGFLGESNTLYRLPLHFVKVTNNQLLTDVNSVPITINGLSACTHPSSSRTYYEILPNQFITTSSLFDYAASATICSPLLVEY